MNDNIDFTKLSAYTICLGTHPGIIQSMLDYNFSIGRDEPNILAIVSGGRKQERYFWGQSEIVVPVYASLMDIPEDIRSKAANLLNVQSGRRVLEGMEEAIPNLPNVKTAAIFAEHVPEAHALKIRSLAKEHNVFVLGPASVGLLVPGVIKLGAIGGIYYPQFVAANIFESGDVAVISSSGGMVNELIHVATRSGNKISFAVALGGDRNPITTPSDAFLLAENDDRTKTIIYFGELGGEDEYEVAELVSSGRVTKKIIAYIAGTVAELFKEPPQFGHAKAMASKDRETARAKKAALKEAGVNVIDVFNDLGSMLSEGKTGGPMAQEHKEIGDRKKSLIVSRISGEVNGEVTVLGENIVDFVDHNSLAGVYISLLLGKTVDSPKLIELTDYILRLLVDHSPNVSGAMNTIVTALAGRDLASSLASGILTIGPRFGGAVNAAAAAWLDGVQKSVDPKEFVQGQGIIPGIGHKKYRIDSPDPRVEALIKKFSGNSNDDKYLKFALSVQEITTSKKGNLILNVDGTIAAIMLDTLESELGYSLDQLKELVDIEFFNALFILSRSVGFTAHYLDQRRHDEGLLRLGSEEVTYIP